MISPLTHGSHNTERFISNNYKETLMFVSGFDRELDNLDSINVLLNTRYVFTEIDHNYVNPVTDQYKDLLDKSMVDINSWKVENAINSNYNSKYTVFNEYMTWTIFDLYVSEKYPSQIYNEMREITISKMQNGRGFIKFKAFEDYLFSVYKSSGKKLEDLYPEMMAWIATQ